MAAIAEAGADLVIVTDDNPRGEDGDANVADNVAGYSRPAAVVVERDRRKEIAGAVGGAGGDDIGLSRGKGQQRDQAEEGVERAGRGRDGKRGGRQGRAGGGKRARKKKGKK